MRGIRPIINEFFNGDFNYDEQAASLRGDMRLAWAIEWLHVQSAKGIPGVRKDLWDDLIKALTEKKKTDKAKAFQLFVDSNILVPLEDRSASTTDDELSKDVAEGLAAKLGIKNIELKGLIYDDDQMQMIKEGFGEEYRDASGLVGRFATYVGGIIDEWNDDELYSPHGAIVQSSGTGKSRLIREYARQGGLVMYCCLREGDSTGYPPRTPAGIPGLITSTSLGHGDSHVQHYLSYLTAILQVYAGLAKRYGFSTGGWFRRHALLECADSDSQVTHPTAIWARVRTHMEKCKEKAGGNTNRMKTMFAKAIRAAGNVAGGRCCSCSTRRAPSPPPSTRTLRTTHSFATFGGR
jgi:hypothetical protein